MGSLNDNVINLTKEFEKKAEEQQKEQLSLLNKRFGETIALFDNLNPEETLAPIIALLQIPEKEFNMFSEIFLDELNKAFINGGNALVMCQAMNMSGTSLEELQEGFQVLSMKLEEEFNLSQSKKDFLKRFFMIIINSIAETQGVSKKIIKIPIELMEGAKVPVYARLGDAGLDIYSTEDIEVLPGETKLVHTGIKIAIPRGYELQVRPKSGISLKTKLRVANAPGTIDSGYRDEVCVIIENIDSPIKDITYDFDEKGRPVITSILHGAPYTIEKGQKIAQLVLSEVVVANFSEVTNISEVEGEDRGGGFGSTGLK